MVEIWKPEWTKLNQAGLEEEEVRRRLAGEGRQEDGTKSNVEVKTNDAREDKKYEDE